VRKRFSLTGEKSCGRWGKVALCCLLSFWAKLLHVGKSVQMLEGYDLEMIVRTLNGHGESNMFEISETDLNPFEIVGKGNSLTISGVFYNEIVIYL